MREVRVREVDAATLVGAGAVPFVRHQVDPDAVERAWVRGDAVVTDGTVSRWADDPPGPVRTCVGPLGDLVTLLAAVDAAAPPPWRVTVEAGVLDALPAAWRPPTPRRWHWMLTRTAPPRLGTDREGPPVRVVTDAEVEAVLDRANPDSFARPGTARVECWLGVGPDAGTVAAVGALVRQADGTGHLRGVSVLPERRGHGLGRALSAALTRRALTGTSATATLGVYVDNAPALAIYRGLGYRTVHTFVSGVTTAYADDGRTRSSTTAVPPSR